MASASDVLAYIDWVWFLQQREQERLDPAIEWQADLSWDEIRACIGIDPDDWPQHEPGQPAGNIEINVQLYWPDPCFSRSFRGVSPRRP